MDIQTKRLIKVLDNMKNLAIQNNIDGDGDSNEELSSMLEQGLNDLQSNDFFGTESQLDPRGDGRDSEWSMWCVEDIDEPQDDEDELDEEI